MSDTEHEMVAHDIILFTEVFLMEVEQAEEIIFGSLSDDDELDDDDVKTIKDMVKVIQKDSK